MRALTVLIVLLLTALPAPAKDIDGEHAVFGLGAQPCSQYLAARQGRGVPMRRYQDWIEAYFSAFNLLVNNTWNIAGTHKLPELLRWMDDWCGQNPEVPFIDAVANLTAVLYPDRLNLAPGKDNRRKWTEELGRGK